MRAFGALFFRLENDDNNNIYDCCVGVAANQIVCVRFVCVACVVLFFRSKDANTTRDQKGYLMTGLPFCCPSDPIRRFFVLLFVLLCKKSYYILRQKRTKQHIPICFVVVDLSIILVLFPP